MSAFQNSKQRLINALLALGRTAEQLGDPLIAQACSRELERLDDGRLLIVVAGEFKSGKSTLINSLLGSPDLSPTDFDIATATAIMIKNGDAPRAYIAPADGSEPREINVRDIKKYAAENQRQPGEQPPRAVLVETPSPFLEGGITLVDTPGVGSLNVAHTEVTFSVISQADLVLFASDARSPLTKHELEFIAARVLPINQSITLVQTKSDTQSSLSTIIQENTGKLRDLAGRDVTILPVSSVLHERYRKTNDQEDLAESGFDALQAHVAGTLRAGGERRILLRAVKSANESAEKLLAPRRAELLAIRERGSPAFQAAKEELTRTRQHFDALQRDRNVRMGRIADGFDEIVERTVRGSLDRQLLDLEYKLQDAAEHADPKTLPSLAKGLEEDIRIAFITTSQEIIAETEKLRQRVARECKLELTTVVRNPELEIRPLPSVSGKDRSWLRNTLDWGGHYRRDLFGGLTAGGVAGAAIGGVIGAFGGPIGLIVGAQLGAALGGAISGLTSFFSATKSMQNRAKDEARKIIERDLMRYLRQARKECTDASSSLANELRHELAREFNTRIEDFITDLRQKDEALNRGLQVAKEQMEARINQLTAEMISIEAPLSDARGAFNEFETAKGATS